MAWVRASAVASVVGCASSFLFSSVGIYVQLLDFRKRIKQVEKAQKLLIFQEKGKFKARYNSDVRPRLEQVKEICAGQDKSCESAKEIAEFAVWYGENRWKEKKREPLQQKERDDIKTVTDMRITTVTFYDDLLESELTTRFPSDGERLDFVTLVAAVYQANMQFAYQEFPYKERDVFIYTMEAISDSEMKEKAKKCQDEVKKMIEEKAHEKATQLQK